MTVTARPSTGTPGRFTEADCSLADFATLVDRTTELADFPQATAVEQNVLVYDAADLRRVVASDAGRLEVEAELVRALTAGPGVVAFTGAYADHAVVDRATGAAEAITLLGDPAHAQVLYDRLTPYAGRPAAAGL